MAHLLLTTSCNCKRKQREWKTMCAHIHAEGSSIMERTTCWPVQPPSCTHSLSATHCIAQLLECWLQHFTKRLDHTIWVTYEQLQTPQAVACVAWGMPVLPLHLHRAFNFRCNIFDNFYTPTQLHCVSNGCAAMLMSKCTRC